jgi:hypothetical protein
LRQVLQFTKLDERSFITDNFQYFVSLLSFPTLMNMVVMSNLRAT